jgi:hypothetical protein
VDGVDAGDQAAAAAPRAALVQARRAALEPLLVELSQQQLAARLHAVLAERELGGRLALPQEADAVAQALGELGDFQVARLGGLDLAALGFTESRAGLSGAPLSAARGWSKKLLLEIKALLDRGDASALSEAGGGEPKKTGEALLVDRDAVWSSIQKGIFPKVGSKSMVKSAVFWKNVLESAADTVRLPVDRSTSLDQYKIVRVPSTLHGSTGLLAQKVDFNTFSGYDALRESRVFSDTSEKVWVSHSPRFEVGGESFGPFESEWADVPQFAAVLLLCHGAATLSEPKAPEANA